MQSVALSVEASEMRGKGTVPDSDRLQKQASDYRLSCHLVHLRCESTLFDDPQAYKCRLHVPTHLTTVQQPLSDVVVVLISRSPVHTNTYSVLHLFA